jgi:hypothetical protein
VPPEAIKWNWLYCSREINVSQNGGVRGMFEVWHDEYVQFASLLPDTQTNTEVDGEDDHDNEPDWSVEYGYLEKIPRQ